MPLANPRRVGQKTIRVLKTEEKGSDVNLASYLRPQPTPAREAQP